MKRYFQQVTKLWQDHKLYSIIIVIATALIITFCMLLYMMYALQTKSMPPESNKSRILKSTLGYSWDDARNADYDQGMSSITARTLFEGLKGVEEVSYMTNRNSGSSAFAGTSPENSYSRTYKRVDDAFFRIYDYTFVAGAPFNKEQSDANRPEVIITDKLANALFGTTDVVGKSIQIARQDNKILGVVKSVSSIFPDSYSEIWRTFNPEDWNWWDNAKDLRGSIVVTLLLEEGYSADLVRKELEERLQAFNDNRTDDYHFQVFLEDADEIKFQMPVSPREQFMGNAKVLNGSLLSLLLISLILLVPAINLAGIHSSQIAKRMPEVGVQKAYGASNSRIMWQFFNENLFLTLVGGIIGLILSIGTIHIFKSNLLQTSSNFFTTASDFTLPWQFFFSIEVFGALLLFCLLVNILSATLPIWRATRIPITETLKKSL